MSQSLPSGQYHADDANFSGSLFHNVNLNGARFDDVNMSRVEIHNVNLNHASIRNACLHDFTFADANYDGMQIEGIPVSELLRVYREQNGIA